jgi:hypothetical protein
MLACLAPRRLFSAATRMAMSGPAVIASASGMDPLDEMFRAMAEATLSAAARARTSPANAVWEEGASIEAWIDAALVPSRDRIGEALARHQALAARFVSPPPQRPGEMVRRKDLEKVYERCETRESEGVLEGTGVREGAEERILGLVGKSALSAARALRFSAAAWAMLEAPPAHLEVFLDCASHAARLEEEKLILTEYVVDMAMALAALGARGTRVGLTVCGKAGGGVYVALAAPAQRVASLYGADIQVLPGSAVAAILGQSRDATPAFDEYRRAGVADLEIKLGIVPGKA